MDDDDDDDDVDSYCAFVFFFSLFLCSLGRANGDRCRNENDEMKMMK